MLEKVENYIRQWKMLEKGDKVVVGLSGGADSVCLFLILEELRKKIGFEILAVHVNHGIRGEEAKADEEFVKTLCEKKEIPCRSVSVDIPKMAVEYRMSEEEAGRTARREYLSRQRKNGEEQGSHWHIIRMTMQRLFSCIWPAAADFGDSAVYIR